MPPSRHAWSRSAEQGELVPPRDTWRDKLRTWWRARNALPSFSNWLLSWGLPFASIFSALLLINGFFIGWWKSYDVLVGITSPASTNIPPLALLLSIGGWLLVPAMVGAVAGYVVERRINRWRAKDMDDINAELAKMRGK